MRNTLVSALIASMVLAGCGGGDGPERPPRVSISVGVVQSLSGAAGVYGKSVVQGVELAVRELNASTSAGLHVDWSVKDDSSTVEGAKAAFSAYTTQEGTTAIIGPTLSQVAPEAHRLAQQAGIPVLSPTTTALGITETGDYVFRVALAEDVVVPNTLAYVSKQTRLRSAVLVLDASDAFSRASADAMRKGLAAVGAGVALEIDIAQQPDVVAALASVRLAAPDAFLVTPLVDQSAQIVKAIREAGFEQQIIGGNSFNTLSIATAAGKAIEGAYVGAAWNPEVASVRSRAFVDAYTRQYGAAPDLFAAQGYTSVYILADAVRRARVADRAVIRTTLAETKDLDTVLGSLSMSAKREAVHAPVVQRYIGGKLVVAQ